jgi:hypothetical protein
VAKFKAMGVLLCQHMYMGNDILRHKEFGPAVSVEASPRQRSHCKRSTIPVHYQ